MQHAGLEWKLGAEVVRFHFDRDTMPIRVARIAFGPALI